MESSNNNIALQAQKKIEEYVSRIQNGESKDSIFEGLPNSFRLGIEQRLVELSQKPEVDDDPLDEIPSQYKGLDSDTLDYMWTFPEYIDPEKTRIIKERKARALEALQKKEAEEERKQERSQAEQKIIQDLKEKIGITNSSATVEKVNLKEESQPLLSLEERRKLHGWPASYELAKIAKQEGVDLSKISREEYMNFAIKNSLAIDDDQLRTAPWQRMGTSVEEIVRTNREKKAEVREDSEKAFARFSFEMQQKARQDDRFLAENIRVRQGTKDSNSWLYFGINKGSGEKQLETYKSYISVKDLNTLTPERFTDLMKVLRDAGYNGDIKIFQDLSEQGVRLNDQIVMHGASENDAKLALAVAEQFFGEDVDQKSVGKDEVIEGESKSYSQILARNISEAIKAQK